MLRALRKKADQLRRQHFPLDSFLKRVPGVIHIGANSGQERERYAALGLNVLWVEPNPPVFEALRSNLSAFPRQRAFRYLLAAEDGAEYTLHIANNEGASSSIFEFARHREIWPEVHYTHDIQVTATTLARLIEIEKIDLRDYGALVLDTQGSELLILRGAIPVLGSFRFVKTEVADFESYAGCCQIGELRSFMRQHGFAMSRKQPFAVREGVGTYYDVLFARRWL
jgi:FkbM family methyltransferase